MVAARVRTIFAQPDASHVERQLKEVAATMKRQFSVVDENHGNSPETIIEIPHPVSTAVGH